MSPAKRALASVLFVALLVGDYRLSRGQSPVTTGQTPPTLPRLVVQLGHVNTVESVAFSPRGRQVLTGSDDHTAKLWDTETGQELRTFRGHSKKVTSVSFSPDGRQVLTGSEDGTAKLWDAQTGAEVRTFKEPTAGEPFVDPTVSSVAFSPDGKKVLTGAELTARLWDVKTGTEIQRFKSSLILSVKFSPNGRSVLTGDYDQTATLWDAKTGALLRTFKGHSGGVSDVAFSSNGRQVLTGSEDQSAKLWDTETGAELRTFKGHSSLGFTSVAMSPDRRWVLAGSFDGTATLWDAKTGVELRTFISPLSIKSVAFSADGRQVLAGSSDHTATIWDAQTGAELRVFRGGVVEAVSVVFSPDGRRVLSGNVDGTAILWDTDTDVGAKIHTFHWDWRLASVALSLDGRHLLTGAFNAAVLWNAESGAKLQMFSKNFDQNKGLEAANGLYVALSPDGRTVLTGGFGGVADLWDAVTGNLIRDFGPNPGWIQSLAYSPDGSMVLTGSQMGAAKLWDFKTGKELQTFNGDSFQVLSVAFSPDGRKVVTGSLIRTAWLWDVATGKQLHKLEGHSDEIGAVAFSPDGRQVVTGSGDTTAKLWDVETGQELRTFEGHTSGVFGVAFSPDGSKLFTASRDGTVKIWDKQSGRVLCTLVLPTNGTWDVIDPDGRFDTADLADMPYVHWVMPDDPLTPLPLEIFMRDYYEPHLLSRVLADQAPPAVQSLAQLNRAQPKVRAPRVVDRDHDKGTVDVEVELEDGEYVNRTTGVKRTTETYDLRLFRDGQLVAQSPESKESTPDGTSGVELTLWQDASRVAMKNDSRVVEAGNRRTVRFGGIRLPHRSGDGATVEFSAYAFNEDRVRSEVSARTKTEAAEGAAEKKAYVVAIGVNEYGATDWKLHYAAKDAREMVESLEPRLKQAGYSVEPTLLVSDQEKQDATRDNIRDAIKGIAGKSTPDDVVIVFYSGHGYSGEHEAFYLLPSDSRPADEPNWNKPSAATLARTISAEQLSRWFRKVDAAELVLIIDACHSAASIEAGGFKPGPLGSRGLGQLAYDKRMRVLAASQSDQAAREMGGQIGEGVLTYALLHDALAAKQAADEHGDITLTRWLEYPVNRVPTLFEEIRLGKVNDYGIPVTKDAIPPQAQGKIKKQGALQTPALFNYGQDSQAGLVLQHGAETSK
jgi:WD40 repeat protein